MQEFEDIEEYYANIAQHETFLTTQFNAFSEPFSRADEGPPEQATPTVGTLQEAALPG